MPTLLQFTFPLRQADARVQLEGRFGDPAKKINLPGVAGSHLHHSPIPRPNSSTKISSVRSEKRNQRRLGAVGTVGFADCSVAPSSMFAACEMPPLSAAEREAERAAAPWP